MSREILFKAKRADNGEWVMGGSIIQFLDDGVRSFYMPQFNEKCICEHDEITDGILKFEDTRFYKVDGDTICQYTGLTDKNGNKIWENDIVKFPDCEMSTESGYGDCFINAGKVAYDTESMSYFFTDRITVDMSDIIIKEEVEVLGNIFDNPELLEESHE